MIITNAIIARLTDQSYDDMMTSACVMKCHHHIADILIFYLSGLVVAEAEGWLVMTVGVDIQHFWF